MTKIFLIKNVLITFNVSWIQSCDPFHGWDGGDGGGGGGQWAVLRSESF